MRFFKHHRRKRYAFTLVEMLVALSIASVLTLIALPAIRNTIRQHTSTRSAEVVRQVFINARAQAIRANRPFGVAMVRTAATGEAADYCRAISFVSAPPAYRGDIAVATGVKLAPVGGDGPNVLRFGFVQLQCARMWYEADTYLNGSAQARRSVTMQPGATIFFNDSLGPFRVRDVVLRNIPHPAAPGTAGVELVVEYLWPSTPLSQLPFVTGSVYPFELHGLPIESFLPGVELPRESAIDLSISGYGLGGVQFNSQAIRCATSTDADMPDSDSGFNRVIVMFGPTGDVQTVYTDTWNTTTLAYDVQPQAVSGTLYLAIGRTDGILDPDVSSRFDTTDSWQGTLPNHANTETAWVTIRSSSGAIAISPQAAPLEPIAAFNAAHSLSSPTTGVTCAARSEQINVLSLRAIRGRNLAKQGANLQ